MEKEYRILIAEDLASDVILVRHELQQVLKKFVTKVVDTEQDFTLGLDEFLPDLIISDYNMGIFNGLTALKITMAKAPLTPLIITTGSVNEETAVLCMKSGAADYVIKENLKRLGPAVLHTLEHKKINEEKIHAEELLKQASINWSATFDSIQTGIALIDASQQIIQANKAFQEFVYKTPEEINGKHCFHFVHGTGCPVDGCPFVKMQQSKNREISEMMINGIACEILVDPIFDNHHNISGAVHIISDISERKLSEKKLFESEKLYRSLFENMLNGFAYCRMHFDDNDNPYDFTYLSVNDAFGKLTGLRNVVGKKVSEVIRGIREMDPGLLEIYGRVSKSGKPESFEIFLDSLMMWFSISVYSPQQEYFVSVFNVITERKLAEEALKKSEAEFHLLAESMPQIVWITDSDGLNIYFNQQWMDYTGQSLEESYGHGWNKPFHPDDQKRAWDAWQNATINEGIYSLECRLRRFDGIYRWWLIRGIPIKQKNGTIQKWFGTCTDIDGLKNYENEIVIAKEQAEQSDRLKSAFLNNMSHEIRTPMNAIVGFSDLITDPDLSTNDRIKFSEIIRLRSNDLLNIVNDILELSRIQTGIATSILIEVNLDEMADQIGMELQQKLLRNKKSHLTVRFVKPDHPDELNFLADQNILKQVFTNLIDNAIKFTDSGSIQFGYQLIDNQNLTCFVSDTGIGIAPENHTLIFENFRQVEMGLSRLFGGAGLGLPICKGLLNLVSGTIWMESELGKGSTFYFKVPVEKVRKNSVKQYTADKAIDLQYRQDVDWTGKRFLIVEDDESNMEFLRILLSSTGAELVYAFDGQETRNLYDRLDTFDLVLLDMRLPDANGWDLAREIKTATPNLPVIAQTAYTLITDQKKCLESGCDDYISKPIMKEKLLSVIKQQLTTGYGNKKS